MVEAVAARALLEHIRSIKRLMQSGTDAPHLTIASAIHEVTNADVYVVAADGHLLGSRTDGSQAATAPSPETAKFLSRIDDTMLDAEAEYPSVAAWAGRQRLAVVPVIAAGNRIASLVAGRDGEAFSPADQILLEYSSTLMGLELFRANASERDADLRRRGAVEQALSALSYSEQEAVRVLFQNLQGEEGVVVASRIADSVGLTRSVIVNALRKLESAGVITSRSLGMKGTFVKVLNRDLVPAVRTSL